MNWKPAVGLVAAAAATADSDVAIDVIDDEKIGTDIDQPTHAQQQLVFEADAKCDGRHRASYRVVVHSDAAIVDSFAPERNPVYMSINDLRLKDFTSNQHAISYKGYTGKKGFLLDLLLLLQNIRSCDISSASPVTSAHVRAVAGHPLERIRLPWRCDTEADGDMCFGDKLLLVKAVARQNRQCVVEFVGCESATHVAIDALQHAVRSAQQRSRCKVTCARVPLMEVWQAQESLACDFRFIGEHMTCDAETFANRQGDSQSWLCDIQITPHAICVVPPQP